MHTAPFASGTLPGGQRTAQPFKASLHALPAGHAGGLAFDAPAGGFFCGLATAGSVTMQTSGFALSCTVPAGHTGPAVHTRMLLSQASPAAQTHPFCASLHTLSCGHAL